MTEMSESVEIAYCDTGEPTELYRQYPGQMQPQPVELLFDLEARKLRARYNPELDGGMPARVWHGVVRCWSVPTILTSRAANALMEQLRPLCQRLAGEATTEWDGSNPVGQLTEAGHALEEAITETIASYAEDISTPRVEPMDAADFLGGASLAQALEEDGIEVTAEASDERLEKIVAELTQNADTSNEYSLMVVEGLEEMLFEHRAELRETERERLDELRDNIAQLQDDLKTQIRWIASWGEKQDTTRALGERAGRSHTDIRRICNREN